MTFTVGGVDVTAVHVGATAADAVYLGSEKVWPTLTVTGPPLVYLSSRTSPNYDTSGVMRFTDTTRHIFNAHDQNGVDGMALLLTATSMRIVYEVDPGHVWQDGPCTAKIYNGAVEVVFASGFGVSQADHSRVVITHINGHPLT